MGMPPDPSAGDRSGRKEPIRYRIDFTWDAKLAESRKRGVAPTVLTQGRAARIESAFLVNITNEKRGIIPFCVPGPLPQRAAYGLKLPETHDLALLANQVHERS